MSNALIPRDLTTNDVSSIEVDQIQGDPCADFGLPNNTGVDPQTDVDCRIVRAGIPFGPEVSAAEAANGRNATDRRLMFICSQTSIPNQVEFVQISWANNPGFIFNKKHPDGTPVNGGS